MADPAEGGGSEQDDVSVLRTVSYLLIHTVLARPSCVQDYIIFGSLIYCINPDSVADKERVCYPAPPPPRSDSNQSSYYARSTPHSHTARYVGNNERGVGLVSIGPPKHTHRWKYLPTQSCTVFAMPPPPSSGVHGIRDLVEPTLPSTKSSSSMGCWRQK